MMKQKKVRRAFIGGILLGIFFFFAIQQNSNNSAPQKIQSYHRFDEILKVLQNTYYDQQKINTGVMIKNAVKAYVDALDDPYTVYMDTTENSGFQAELKGEQDFEGIGAVISKKDNYILVEEIIKDSPAFKGGIFPLDKIIMINTGSTKNISVNEAVAQIRGPKGTQVKMIIERTQKDGSKNILQKEITRDKLSVPSVTSKVISGKNNTSIGYINISVIGEETENILKLNILQVKQEKVKGIILDLRGNGGGFLPIAVEIASHFVPKNKLIVSAKYKQLGEESFYSKGYGDLEKTPVAVLVDGLTASAGEIIALALQEQIGAKIIGTQTFGKGSIQTVSDFTDGTSLKYTIGKRYSPSGKNIDKIGITPDIISEFDSKLYEQTRQDAQLEKAIQILGKQ